MSSHDTVESALEEYHLAIAHNEHNETKLYLAAKAIRLLEEERAQYLNGNYKPEPEEEEEEDYAAETPTPPPQALTPIMSEEEDVFDDDDDDEGSGELEDIKVALKPNCNVLGSIKEFRTNENIGTVELDVYKNWLSNADEEHAWALFDALGTHPNLQKLSIRSKGAATQSLPVSHLTHFLGEATELLALETEHVHWKGDQDDFELLAATMGEHQALEILQVTCESIDDWEGTIAAAGKIPTLQQVELTSGVPASDKAGLHPPCLTSLFSSLSIRILKLVYCVNQQPNVMTHVARLLGSSNNTTSLQELMLHAQELDLASGTALAQMLTVNQGLSNFVLQLDKFVAGKQIGEAFFQALEMNSTLSYFQIILDGRMSDIKATRAMQMLFRDLRPMYKISSQVGLNMGVTAERPQEEELEDEPED